MFLCVFGPVRRLHSKTLDSETGVMMKLVWEAEGWVGGDEGFVVVVVVVVGGCG